MSNVLRKINSEILDYTGKNVQIVPGLWFNQKNNIEKIYFYYNSKFQTGDTDEEGDRKYFYNINRNPCKVMSKAIDFDTKNIRLLTTGGGSTEKTWYMERDLAYWMRDKQFGKVLNRIFKEIPIFGTVVLKIVEGCPYFVDLRNLIVEQGAENLDSSNYIIEIHNYTVAEFRKVAKQMKWDSKKVEEAITKFHEMKGVSHIRLIERYGVAEEESESGAKSYPYKRVFLADVGVDEYDQYGTLTAQKAGVDLSSEEWEGHPYWEFHADKLPGRWQGVGVVEELFEPQIASNQNVNLQNKSAFWSALRVFQTRDSGFTRNLATDSRNGEVFNVEDPITQVDMSDRNLGFFNDQHQKWLQNRAELTFAYDVVQGERLPSGTPLGSAQIAISQTLSYFEGIQENVALDIKEMLYEAIIPSFQKENTKEHTLRLVGKDLDEYAAMVKNDLVLQETTRQAILSMDSDNKFPTSDDVDTITLAIEEAIKQGKEKILTIPKNFYKDVKFDVDIDITGESVDTRVRAATKFAILQAITADPTMTQDPFKRKLLMSYMEDGGLNPSDFFDVEAKDPEDMLAAQGAPVSRAGGGVSAPALANSVPGANNTSV